MQKYLNKCLKAKDCNDHLWRDLNNLIKPVFGDKSEFKSITNLAETMIILC